MKNSHDFRSPLGKVRAFGSAHEGTGHFIWQRLTALVLVPLTIWFIYSLLHVAVNNDADSINRWLSSGLNAVALIAMLLALFYHAKLGMQVIIEDYVHAPKTKFLSLLLNLLIMFAFALMSVLAVLTIHFQSLTQDIAG